MILTCQPDKSNSVRKFSGQGRAAKSKVLGWQSLNRLTSDADIKSGIAGHLGELCIKDYEAGVEAKAYPPWKTLDSHFPLKPGHSCQSINTSLPGRHARPLQLEIKSRWCASKILKTSTKFASPARPFCSPRGPQGPSPTTPLPI